MLKNSYKDIAENMYTTNLINNLRHSEYCLLLHIKYLERNIAM